MAGQEQRGSRGRGPSSRRDSAVALAAAGPVDGPGSEAITSTTGPTQVATPAAPTPSPRAVWRLLQMKGMTPDEAANLTAFLYGLPTADLRWSLDQLNQLLFLREMRQAGRFGRLDGDTDPEP